MSREGEPEFQRQPEQKSAHLSGPDFSRQNDPDEQVEESDQRTTFADAKAQASAQKTEELNPSPSTPGKSPGARRQQFLVSCL